MFQSEWCRCSAVQCIELAERILRVWAPAYQAHPTCRSLSANLQLQSIAVTIFQCIAVITIIIDTLRSCGVGGGVGAGLFIIYYNPPPPIMPQWYALYMFANHDFV